MIDIREHGGIFGGTKKGLSTFLDVVEPRLELVRDVYSASSSITSVDIDNSGNYYTSTWQSLDKFSPSNELIFRMTDEKTGIFFLLGGFIYYAKNDGYIYKYDKENGDYLSKVQYNTNHFDAYMYADKYSFAIDKKNNFAYFGYPITASSFQFGRFDFSTNEFHNLKTYSLTNRLKVILCDDAYYLARGSVIEKWSGLSMVKSVNITHNVDAWGIDQDSENIVITSSSGATRYITNVDLANPLLPFLNRMVEAPQSHGYLIAIDKFTGIMFRVDTKQIYIYFGKKRSNQYTLNLNTTYDEYDIPNNFNYMFSENSKVFIVDRRGKMYRLHFPINKY